MTYYRWENCQFLPDPDGEWIRVEWTIPHGMAMTPPGHDGETVVVWTLRSTCWTSELSSRMCDHGTKGCDVRH